MFPLWTAGAGLAGNNGDISLELDAQQDWHPGRQPVVLPDIFHRFNMYSFLKYLLGFKISLLLSNLDCLV